MIYNNAAFWKTVHLLWLEFQSWPIVVYSEGPGLIGSILPALFSLLIIVHDWRRWKALSHSAFPVLLGMMLASIVIGINSGYWTTMGYHFFNMGLIFWPCLALISPNFRAWWAYPLTFFPMLIVDFLGAGTKSHWVRYFWFGVGGAGFHDALFLDPATALICSLFCAALSARLRNIGILNSANYL